MIDFDVALIRAQIGTAILLIGMVSWLRYIDWREQRNKRKKD